MAAKLGLCGFGSSTWSRARPPYDRSSAAFRAAIFGIFNEVALPLSAFPRSAALRSLRGLASGPGQGGPLLLHPSPLQCISHGQYDGSDENSDDAERDQTADNANEYQ